MRTLWFTFLPSLLWKSFCHLFIPGDLIPLPWAGCESKIFCYPRGQRSSLQTADASASTIFLFLPASFFSLCQLLNVSNSKLSPRLGLPIRGTGSCCCTKAIDCSPYHRISLWYHGYGGGKKCKCLSLWFYGNSQKWFLTSIKSS